jgi:hypothetical protein
MPTCEARTWSLWHELRMGYAYVRVTSRTRFFNYEGPPATHWCLVCPSQLSKLEPLLLAENKKKLLSSGLADSLLARVRGVLLYLLCLQQKEHPDLVLADVPTRTTNYWMKSTGASDAASRGVPE